MPRRRLATTNAARIRNQIDPLSCRQDSTSWNRSQVDERPIQPEPLCAHLLVSDRRLRCRGYSAGAAWTALRASASFHAIAVSRGTMPCVRRTGFEEWRLGRSRARDVLACCMLNITDLVRSILASDTPGHFGVSTDLQASVRGTTRVRRQLFPAPFLFLMMDIRREALRLAFPAATSAQTSIRRLGGGCLGWQAQPANTPVDARQTSES